MLNLLVRLFTNKNCDKSKVETEKRKEKQMANFTMKETNLLFQTIIERDLGITLADNMSDLRSKQQIFNDFSKKVVIEQFDNKQDTTRVRIFRTEYVDPDTGCSKVAYTHTL